MNTPDGGVGSGVFHEKACREFCLKRFTFFLFLNLADGAAGFPNGQASIRTLVAASTAARCREESKVFEKGRPCLLVSALSGEAHAGARSQWPKD